MADVNRPFPKVVHRQSVACQSSRRGTKPVLIVLHDTEGANVPNSARDLEGLGNFFNRISTQASSHIGVDEDGCSARYVLDAEKAWTQAYYNPWSLSIEQIGFASDNWKGAKKRQQLEEVARWIARWHRVHGIPIRKGRVSQDGRVLRSGVVQHRELGSLGGDHHDVSLGYPMVEVLRLARRYAKFQTKVRNQAKED